MTKITKETMMTNLKELVDLLLSHATATDGDTYFIKIQKSTLDKLIKDLENMSNYEPDMVFTDEKGNKYEVVCDDDHECTTTKHVSEFIIKPLNAEHKVTKPNAIKAEI